MTMSNQEQPTEPSMNKAQIVAELEKMAVARLFSDQPWPADEETCSAMHRKLIKMGLWEQVCDEPLTWRITPLGEQLDVDLFQVFMGRCYEWEATLTLKEYGLLSESEVDAIFECASEVDAESLLNGYVKRAYFDYHNGKFCTDLSPNRIGGNRRRNPNQELKAEHPASRT
jgi:hypothetical protein